jgi:hypothetical protein
LLTAIALRRSEGMQKKFGTVRITRGDEVSRREQCSKPARINELAN